MTRFLIESKDWIYVYRLLSFAKNIKKDISKDIRGKFSKRFLDHGLC